MEPSKEDKETPKSGDALIVVDVQNDFLPGGSLAVPGGDEVIPVLNRYIALFQSKDLPIFATRDWHPSGHSSFKEKGGPWPPHCVKGSEGARFAEDLQLPPSIAVISKDTEIDVSTYSGFQKTDLAERLRSQGIERLFIGGLATDYCVLNTVKDGLERGFHIFLLKDAVRPVNVRPDDGQKAEDEMIRLGAVPLTLEMIQNA